MLFGSGGTLCELKGYLQASESHEDDFASMKELRHLGSGEWLTKSTSLTTWLEQKPSESQIFWLSGEPSTGKSVLAGLVAETASANGFASSYFFRSGRTENTTLSPCLLSLAYQMALLDDSVLEKILSMSRDGVKWDEDEKSIWRKLFVSGIFKVGPLSHHRWIIDGLDECARFTNLFHFLQKFPTGLRIFVTSRNIEEISRGMASLRSKVLSMNLTSSDACA